MDSATDEEKEKEKSIPKCVIFCSKGATGEKLLYMYPFKRHSTPDAEKAELPTTHSSQGPPPRDKTLKPVVKKLNYTSVNENNIMTQFRLTTDILANILNVHEKACNQPFEMKIDNVRFASRPTKVVQPDKNNSSISHIAVVFALPANVDTNVIESFQGLSHKLAVAFNMLHKCEGYLHEQEKILSEDEHDPEVRNSHDPFAKLRHKSSLAKLLAEVVDDIHRFGHVHKYVGNFVEVSHCVESQALTKLNVVPKGRKDIDRIVSLIKPYHGILLLEDVWPTPDANPSVTLLLKHCSPDRSILDMSTASGIPLLEVFMIIRHLLLWTRAVLIYPLCNTNVYTSATSPQSLEKMIQKFKDSFGASFHLAAGLAHFNPPNSLGSFIRPNLPLSEQQVRAKVVVALLRYQLLMQLHLFCYIINPFSNAETPRSGRHCPEYLKKEIVQCAALDQVHNIVPDICGQMLETECASEVEQKLRLFLKMAPFMNGSHHVEDIKYKLNVDREEIMKVIDAFELVIAKFLRPDFIVE